MILNRAILKWPKSHSLIIKWSSNRLIRSNSMSHKLKLLKDVKIGIAVSGGVDSMALAYLVKKIARQTDELYGIIVDHKLRPTSSEESEQTAKTLNRLGIHPIIVTADTLKTDVKHGNSNLETVAREARFKLLGQTCKDLGITTLLLAHHRDDAYETAIYRMTNQGSLNLGRMPLEQDIPHNNGIFGIHKSGGSITPLYSSLRTSTKAKNVDSVLQGTRAFETGGVKISKPLANLFKADLIQICQRNKIPWIEDPSNTDASLTLRNTIRNRLPDSVLPKALQRHQFLQSRDEIHRVWDCHKAVADRLFDQCQLRFNPMFGYLIVKIQPPCMEKFENIAKEVIGETDFVKLNYHFVLSLLLRRLILIVTPHDDVDAKSVHPLSEQWLQNCEDGATKLGSYECRNVNISNKAQSKMHLLLNNGKAIIHDPDIWIFTRSPEKLDASGRGVDKNRTKILSFDVDAFKTKTVFYDNRFWITITNPFNRSLTVRPMESKYFEALADMFTKQEISFRVQLGHLRFQELTNSSNDLRNVSIPDLKSKSHRKCQYTIWSLGIVPRFVTSKVIIPMLKFSSEIDILGFPTLGVQVINKERKFNADGSESLLRLLKWKVTYKKTDWGAHHSHFDPTVVTRGVKAPGLILPISRTKGTLGNRWEFIPFEEHDPEASDLSLAKEQEAKIDSAQDVLKNMMNEITNMSKRQANGEDDILNTGSDIIENANDVGKIDGSREQLRKKTLRIRKPFAKGMDIRNINHARERIGQKLLIHKHIIKSEDAASESPSFKISTHLHSPEVSLHSPQFIASKENNKFRRLDPEMLSIEQTANYNGSKSVFQAVATSKAVERAKKHPDRNLLRRSIENFIEKNNHDAIFKPRSLKFPPHLQNTEEKKGRDMLDSLVNSMMQKGHSQAGQYQTGSSLPRHVRPWSRGTARNKVNQFKVMETTSGVRDSSRRPARISPTKGKENSQKKELPKKK